MHCVGFCLNQPYSWSLVSLEMTLRMKLCPEIPGNSAGFWAFHSHRVREKNKISSQKASIQPRTSVNKYLKLVWSTLAIEVAGFTHKVKNYCWWNRNQDQKGWQQNRESTERDSHRYNQLLSEIREIIWLGKGCLFHRGYSNNYVDRDR